MKSWKYIEASDTIMEGFTEDGYSYFELEIVGYNDFDDLAESDVLATLRGVKEHNKVIFTTEYHIDQSNLNEIIYARLEEAKQDIEDMFD